MKQINIKVQQKCKEVEGRKGFTNKKDDKILGKKCPFLDLPINHAAERFCSAERKLCVKEEVGLRDKAAKNSDNFFHQFVSRICPIFFKSASIRTC